MSAFAHHALLGLSVAALGGAGLRLASLAAPQGLERALAAATLACAAAVIAALGLGLFGLGGNAVALAVAAGATWLAACALLPAPGLGAAPELARWWRRLTRPERLIVGALAGAWLAWTAWLLRYPALGYDTLLYHLPESVLWVHGGSPGSVEPVVSGLPVGSYPVTHEVLSAWGLAQARGFVPASLLVPVAILLAAAGGWSCLRGLRVPRPAAGLAVAAVLLSPSAFATGESGATLDPAALAWLAACAALCVGSLRSPALLAPALVAAGMAFGTKTTALPLAVTATALALLAGRRHLRRLAVPLLLAGTAAAVVGATWYLRNLFQHGSPFWPYLTLPWGDPAPAAVEAADISFLDRPSETLDRIGDRYLDQFAGGVVLLAGALAAPLLVRRREVVAGAVATGLSLLLWLNAPLTGVSDNPGFDEGTADAVRYLLPALGAAALTLGLAARPEGRTRTIVTGLLAISLALALLNTLGMGFPAVPSAATLAAGAVAGALLAVVAWKRPRIRLDAPGARLAAALATAAVAGGLLAPLAPGYLDRHTDAGLFDSGLVAWFADRDGDERPVAISGALHGLLAGERLQRELELIPPREPCPEVERRRARGWVVFTELVRRRMQADVRECLGAEAPAYRDRDFRVFAPDGGS